MIALFVTVEIKKARMTVRAFVICKILRLSHLVNSL